MLMALALCNLLSFLTSYSDEPTILPLEAVCNKDFCPHLWMNSQAARLVGSYGHS